MRVVLNLNEELARYFAADPEGPLYTVPRVAADPSHPLWSVIHEALAAFSTDLLDEFLLDADFLWLNEGMKPDALNAEAREGLLIQELNRAVPRMRVAALINPTRPAIPYGMEELSDLAVDDEDLVPLREFGVNEATLERNGRAFMMAPSVESPNSMYWLLLQLRKLGIVDQTSVRLDPFMHGPVGRFPVLFYRMWLYGRQLDWDRLSKLKGSDFGQWVPDTMSRGIQRTDFVWEARDGEVHFICEELPCIDRVATRGARYLHAIYRPDRDRIIHLDGAIRLYNRAELEDRVKLHVREAGKAGQRIKLFRTDHPVSRECLSDLAVSFFVWNDDIARYFGPARRERVA
jgi:hypothetical protein